MVRTRFAPSPTGYLHVGGLRTAMYAYLHAKKNNGKFLLRIEDTDQKRLVKDSLENLISSLKWAGLDHDEGPQIDGSTKGDKGPYIQSKRTELYREHAQKLLELGAAYRCFCSKERLDEMREAQLRNGQATMYDRKCANLPQSTIDDFLNQKTPFVIRQKMPYKTIKFKDIIRGNVQFDCKKIDDQILMKSDGFPTYHLANVVDDHFMEITHVIRGEEWLPSTPKHIALYEAFGWEAPQFAHLSLLLNSDRTKLSKRQGDVSVQQYIDKGYLKEAILNFIVFLGWNPGAGEEREIFTLQELEEIFDLSKVNKAGAVFNLDKLDWFNWKWKKQNHNQTLKSIAKELEPNIEIKTTKKGHLIFNFNKPENQEKFNKKRGELLLKLSEKQSQEYYNKDPEKTLKALVTLEEKILKKPEEIIEQLSSFFTLPKYSKSLLSHEKMKVDQELAQKVLTEIHNTLSKVENWTMQNIRTSLIEMIAQLGIKNGQALWPMRSALSGIEFSPGAFEMAFVLGKTETLNRLKTATS